VCLGLPFADLSEVPVICALVAEQVPSHIYHVCRVSDSFDVGRSFFSAVIVGRFALLDLLTEEAGGNRREVCGALGLLRENGDHLILEDNVRVPLIGYRVQVGVVD